MQTELMAAVNLKNSMNFDEFLFISDGPGQFFVARVGPAIYGSGGLCRFAYWTFQLLSFRLRHFAYFVSPTTLIRLRCDDDDFIAYLT